MSDLTEDDVKRWIDAHPECSQLLPQQWYYEAGADEQQWMESFGVDYPKAIQLIRALLADPPVHQEPYCAYWRLNPDHTVTPWDGVGWPPLNQSGQPVARTRIKRHDVEIATVFLGVNRRPEPGPPWIFETLVSSVRYPELDDRWVGRYSTYAEAKAGHKAMVEWVKMYLELGGTMRSQRDEDQP